MRVRMLRSQSCSVLKASKMHTAMCGDKYFRESDPKLWNKLPHYIKLAASKDFIFKICLCYMSLEHALYFRCETS